MSQNKRLKLEACGIRGSTDELLRSYLFCRQQLVEMSEIQSTTKTLKIGVPQGTVLGPILIKIYIYSIFSVKKSAKIVDFC